MNNNILYHRNLNSNGQAFPFVQEPGGNDNAGDIVINNINERKGIGVTPAAVIGSLIGGALANGVLTRNYIKDQDNRRMAELTKELKNRPKVEGNYYKQVQNVANNLDVAFTPVSAVLRVRNGKDSFTLDTIETSEMNNDMKKAWKNKSSDYFKNLLLGKMYSEMQIAEEAFAKRFIKNHFDMKGIVDKKSYDTSLINNFNLNKCAEVIEKVASFYNDSDIKVKIASANIQDIENVEGNINIGLKLDRPFNKYAGVIGSIKSCIGLNREPSSEEVKKHLENPKYLMKNIKVGFFPDRVIFTMDNNLVSTLSLTGMNEEGYQNFVNSNEKYFRNLFVENVKENLKMADSELDGIYKIAFEETEEFTDPKECLVSSGAHPVVIYLFLLKHYGLKWLKFDMSIIEEILKKEFSLEEINDSTLNKILTIMTANQSDSIYTNAYAFEKAVLSLNSKPIDFMLKEKENISIQNIVFAIDVLDRVTMNDDIYDNFSPEVVDYIVDVFSDREMYIYNPTNIVSSPLEPQFKETVNEFLLKKMKIKMTLASDDPEVDKEIENNCEYISDNANAVINAIRRFDNSNSQITYENVKDLIDSIIIKKSIREDLAKIVKKQVLTSLALDTVLAIFNNQFESQMTTYGLKQ